MFFSVHKCRQFYFYMDFVSELWHLSDFTPDLNYKKSSVSYYICLVFHSSANIILQENESGRAGLKSDLAVTCSACDESISFQTSANITKKGKVLRCKQKGCLSLPGIRNWLQRACILLWNHEHALYVKKCLPKTGRQHPRGCRRLHKANARATAMEKKCRQGLQLVRTRREEALLQIGGPTYDPGGF